MADTRKAFHFDLDIRQLKEHYPSTSPFGYKQAWSDIKKFMEENGFIHTQYSGYESSQDLSTFAAFQIIIRLQRKHPWFSQCAQAATMTDIGNRHDVLSHLKEHKKDASLTSSPARDEKVSLASEIGMARRASQELNRECFLSNQIKEQFLVR